MESNIFNIERKRINNKYNSISSILLDYIPMEIVKIIQQYYYMKPYEMIFISLAKRCCESNGNNNDIGFIFNDNRFFVIYKIKNGYKIDRYESLQCVSSWIEKWDNYFYEMCNIKNFIVRINESHYFYNLNNKTLERNIESLNGIQDDFIKGYIVNNIFYNVNVRSIVTFNIITNKIKKYKIPIQRMTFDMLFVNEQYYDIYNNILFIYNKNGKVCKNKTISKCCDNIIVGFTITKFCNKIALFKSCYIHSPLIKIYDMLDNTFEEDNFPNYLEVYDIMSNKCFINVFK